MHGWKHLLQPWAWLYVSYLSDLWLLAFSYCNIIWQHVNYVILLCEAVSNLITVPSKHPVFKDCMAWLLWLCRLWSLCWPVLAGSLWFRRFGQSAKQLTRFCSGTSSRAHLRSGQASHGQWCHNHGLSKIRLLQQYLRLNLQSEILVLFLRGVILLKYETESSGRRPIVCFRLDLPSTWASSYRNSKLKVLDLSSSSNHFKLGLKFVGRWAPCQSLFGCMVTANCKQHQTTIGFRKILKNWAFAMEMHWKMEHSIHACIVFCHFFPTSTARSQCLNQKSCQKAMSDKMSEAMPE